MDTMTIQTKGLTRSFGNIQAVNGLDLAVPEGSIYGFLGPNGAGKTTTIRILLGLIRPTSGQTSLFGQPVTSINDLNRLLAGIGALVETPSFYPNLTGRENVALIAGLRRQKADEVRSALATVDLEKAADRLVRQYSLGMRQRLGLAIALLGRPRLLVLDEPTNGLDPAGIHEIRDLIRQLPQRLGITVFLSSHLLNEVEQIASHIGIIQEGRLIFQGATPSLQARFNRLAHLTTDRLEAACACLRKHGWQARVENLERITVEANGETDLAQIVQQLVQSGFQIYDARLEKPSLEEIFLNLTTQPETRAAAAPAQLQAVPTR